MAVLRTPRLIAYFGTWAFGVVAGAAALNGLVKARHDRDADAKLAEELASATFGNFKVVININDSLTAGGFLAAGELLLSIIAWCSLSALVLASLSNPTRRHKLYDEVNRRTERKGTMAFALFWWIFGLLWTFGTAVASLDYGRNRSAKTRAWIDGQEVPQATVKALQAATGLSSRYWIHGYTKFADISPWPLIFFAILSTVLTFMAWSRTSSDGVASYGYDSSAPTETRERTSESVDEEKSNTKHAENSV